MNTIIDLTDQEDIPQSDKNLKQQIFIDLTDIDDKMVLLLGMVFSSEQRHNKRGQEYRDRIRCEALEHLGYEVRTLDNKHSDGLLSKHCHASFTDFRRMEKNMQLKWGKPQFVHVILDYFFSPVNSHG